jgi:hypothetical protein
MNPNIRRGSIRGEKIDADKIAGLAPVIWEDLDMDMDNVAAGDRILEEDMEHLAFSGIPLFQEDANLWIETSSSLPGRVPLIRAPIIQQGEKSTKNWRHFACVYGSEIQLENKAEQPEVDELVFKLSSKNGHGSCTKLYERERRLVLFFDEGVAIPAGSMQIAKFGFPCPAHRFFEIRGPGKDREMLKSGKLPWVYVSLHASDEELMNPIFSLCC